MFVGGEFYDEPRWTAESPTLSTEHMVFLNGGAACLTVIGDFLRDHGIHKVLLPSYLCPSILDVFERCGLGWEFYPVCQDLSIDLEQLAQQIDGQAAVYLINYFGFSHSTAVQDFFRQLQHNGLIVIEDNAQAGFPEQTLGDFVFNSIRKLAAYDGGYLLINHKAAQYDIAPILKKYQGTPNRRLPLIREYRQRLYRYLYEGTDSHSALEALYQRAAGLYETDLVVIGDAQERCQIERLDWAAIHQIRRDNYQYLMDWVTSIPEITPIFPALQAHNMPFGLPVIFSGVSRDRVYEELGKASISLMIHWEELRSDPRTQQNQQAAALADRILTLPIDQRIRRKQLDYLAMHLIRTIAMVKEENL